LIAFPSTIGSGDSTIVIATAADPDGDALVYDWVTDSRLIIKGNAPNDNERFGSPDAFQVFYYGAPLPQDSAWVECTAQDRKGGVAVRMVRIYFN